MSLAHFYILFKILGRVYSTGEYDNGDSFQKADAVCAVLFASEATLPCTKVISGSHAAQGRRWKPRSLERLAGCFIGPGQSMDQQHVASEKT